MHKITTGKYKMFSLRATVMRNESFYSRRHSFKQHRPKNPEPLLF